MKGTFSKEILLNFPSLAQNLWLNYATLNSQLIFQMNCFLIHF